MKKLEKEELRNREILMNGKGIKDSFRGLKIICKWICGLIEIHFKSKAILYVQTKINEVRKFEFKAFVHRLIRRYIN